MLFVIPLNIVSQLLVLNYRSFQFKAVQNKAVNLIKSYCSYFLQKAGEETGEKVAVEQVVKAAQEAAANAAKAIIGDAGAALGLQIGSEVGNEIAQKLGKLMGGEVGAVAGRARGLEVALELVHVALEGVNPLKIDAAQMAKLLDNVANAATAKATEVGAVAGREAALKIDLVKIHLLHSL
jgi:hypothetical protein